MAFVIIAASIGFGLILGSFLNVLITRFPLSLSERGSSVYRGRSRCDHCEKTLSWYELIPVVSFVALGGKCARCAKPISSVYTGVELLLGALFALVGYFFVYADGINGIVTAYIFSSTWFYAHGLLVYGAVFVLLGIFLFDLRYRYIPDTFTGLLVVFGIIESYLKIFILHTEALFPVMVTALGASGVFFALWFFTRGRGMGFGDVKLAFAIPLLVGSLQGIAALLLSFWIGAVWSLLLVAFGRKTMKDSIPFGPFMVLGTYLIIFYPNLANSLLFWGYGIL